MKLTLLILAASLAGLAGTPLPAVVEQVKSAEQRWANGMIRGNLTDLEKVLADDIVYTHSDTRPETKKEILDGIKSGATKINGIEFQESKYRQYGDTVVANHKLTIDNAKSGKLTLYVTHVWVKENGEWKLANRQSTRYPAPK
jgi:ketosteroid isomerase-like protein